jgi:hypothetical protein
MVSKGLEQAKKFSWDRAAMETQEVYEKVGGTGWSGSNTIKKSRSL